MEKQLKNELKAIREEKRNVHDKIAAAKIKMSAMNSNDDKWQELFNQKLELGEELYKLVKQEEKLLEKIESIT